MLTNQPAQGSHPLTSSEWEVRWRRLSAPARLAVVRAVPAPQGPEWVARSLDNPLAEAVLRAVEGAGGVVARDELPALLPNSDPQAVRAMEEALIARLALFEDLRPGSLDLLLGFLPSVREGLRRARQPRARPPLAV